jgi:SAM-dependent methyltransferase
MIPVDYLALRLIRRHLPVRIVRLMLRRRIVIKPGLETTDPSAALQRFLDAIAAAGCVILRRRVLIFGYGGNYGVGVGLLQAGAKHVVLVDPYAEPARAANRALAAGSPYLTVSALEARPVPEWLTVVNAPIGEYLSRGGERVDLVLSNSVLEHVGDVAGTVPDLTRVTAPGGQHIHFVDLRDHFFKHPFEMLCHSERTWRGFLNPGSNLNRMRARDYERIFRASFPRVTVEPLATDLAAFRKVRARIRPEFLTGSDEQDAVTRILVRASVD